MKYFCAVLLFAACVSGEAPVGDYPGRLARLDSAPYEPAGYKPSIPFILPSRQQQQPNYLPPQDFNGPNSSNGSAPRQQFGPPQQTYGTPEIEFTPPQQQYNPTFQQQQRYNPSFQQQQQYNPSFQQQQQYNPSFQQQQQYNPSFQPQQQYNPSFQPQQRYIPSFQQQQQYLPPQQQFYGAPGQEQYNPQQSAQQYRPNQQYAPPVEHYGPPEGEYGPPPEEVTEQESETTTTEVPTTTEANTEFEGEQLKDEENVADDAEKQMGIYYIYHPSGMLQKILFATKNDLKNMAYTAQFKYEDVEPIREPIFTYDPQTLQLKRLSA